MSKVLCLIKHIPKKGSVYLLIDVQEKLDNFTDLISEAITNKKVIIHKEGEPQPKELSIKCPYVNFSGFKNGQPIIESPLTKKALGGNSLTTVGLCYNLQGERLGIILSDSNGELYKMSSEQAVNCLKGKNNIINNLFLRNGSEMVLTKGNYIENKDGVISCVPKIVVGTRLTKGKVELVEEDITETKTEVEKKNYKLDNLRKPIKMMYILGYGPYVEKFRLNNKAYSDLTLMYYLQLFKNKHFNVVANMLTTEPYDRMQLHEIALGIMHGVDIKKYATLDTDATEMARARRILEKGGIYSFAMPSKLKKMIDTWEKGHFQDEKLGKIIDQAKSKIKKGMKNNG